jgi:sialic acid synthase SpsE
VQTIAADEDSIADQADVIFKQISDLPVFKIGSFKQDTVGLHTIVEQVQKIKISTTFNNYQDIASATTELSMNLNLLRLSKNF